MSIASPLSSLSICYILPLLAIPSREKNRHGLFTDNKGMSAYSRSDSNGKDPHQKLTPKFSVIMN